MYGARKKRTEPDGSFTLGLEPARYLVFAEHKQYGITRRIVNVEPGSGQFIKLELGRGTEVLFKPRVKSTQYLLYQITGPSGAAIWARHVQGRTRTYKFQLAKGDYVLRIFNDLNLLRTIPFAVGGKPLTLRDQ